MNKTIFSFLLFLLPFILFSQKKFPKSWIGTYEGKLEILGVNKINMLVDMKLEIQKKSDSIYAWNLIYEHDGKEDKRLYELKVVDKEKGHYVIDEKNSILIDGYYHLNQFTSVFEVNGSYIVTGYTMTDDAIEFEITAGSMMNPNITGNQEYEGEQIPEVKAYGINGKQVAILFKVD